MRKHIKTNITLSPIQGRTVECHSVLVPRKVNTHMEESYEVH